MSATLTVELYAYHHLIKQIHEHPKDWSQSIHPMKHCLHNCIMDILQAQGGRMDV